MYSREIDPSTPMHRRYPYTWPHPENTGVIYRYERNGDYKNVMYNEIWPLFGIIPWRDGKEYETFRCADLYPIVYGMQYMDERGCSYQQFKDEADLVRCKSCYQAFDKRTLLRIFGNIKGMQIWEREYEIK